MGHKKLTLEIFKERATKVHNGFYNYDKSIYQSTKKKIIITCPIHGDFEQLPANHLKGMNCKHCGLKNISNKTTKSHDLWISEFNQIHNNKYEYIEIIKSSKHKINILCKKHGIFNQLASSHLQGNGCPKCRRENFGLRKCMSDEQWRERFKIVHNNLYEYPDYIKCNKKIRVTCKIHGDFYQNCKDHTRGTGCPNCFKENNNFSKSYWIKAGQKKNNLGIFYIIKCWNESEEFFKFGITYQNTKNRYSNFYKMPYNYKILREIKSYDLEYIWDLEKRFKKFKKNQHYKPLIYFKGSKTECFKNE